MLGLMQDRPLMVSSLLEHAARYHGGVEIVSRSVEGPIHRTNYADVQRRAKRVANTLAALGIGASDRVGTLAWNTYRHLELYYGVSGSGAVLHTVNPRLFPAQVQYIVTHAEDRILFFDATFASLVEQLAPNLDTVEYFVALTDREHMPDIQVRNLLCYEDLIATQSDQYEWPSFDERTASSLCYTSGTTGNPKGVLYSHRSTVLHSLMECAPDTFGVSTAESLLLAVPMFHANAWGMPYSAPLVGAKLVLPGPRLDGDNMYELMRDERVTFSQAVPTVWLMFFQYLDAHPELNVRDLKLRTVGVGGAALPRTMLERFERDYGITVVQGWGMTETSPIGVIARPLPKHEHLSYEESVAVKLKQGRAVWGVELKLVDVNGMEAANDGRSPGHLHVRGPWIASGYFRGEGGDVLDSQGWFPTGDIATIDADGYVQLVDRAKDVIKSGGEWISSIEIENAVMAHPAIAEAAIVGVAHPKWQERPLLIVVPRAGSKVSRDELLAFLAPQFASWWLPDDVVFVTDLPHTATGKILKASLREQFRDHLLMTGLAETHQPEAA
ncbi:MAG TPA: long-chain-fatty-acid--CoA ligase [Burkholderiaceae bacterium]|nr:long-chain-fatty-acid--CoA ligase [Burkholderiaceae bacterium]